MKDAEFILAELWLGGNILIEEHWEDILNDETGESRLEPRYSLPGGKVEQDESDAAAVIRCVQEKTGIDLTVAGGVLIKEAEMVVSEPVKVRIFRKLLDPLVTPGDGILICPALDVYDFGKEGKLMPYTHQYVNKEFTVVKNGA